MSSPLRFFLLGLLLTHVGARRLLVSTVTQFPEVAGTWGGKVVSFTPQVAGCADLTTLAPLLNVAFVYRVLPSPSSTDSTWIFLSNESALESGLTHPAQSNCFRESGGECLSCPGPAGNGPKACGTYSNFCPSSGEYASAGVAHPNGLKWCNSILRTASKLYIYSAAVEPSAQPKCAAVPTETGFGAEEAKKAGAQLAMVFEARSGAKGPSEWACKKTG